MPVIEKSGSHSSLSLLRQVPLFSQLEVPYLEELSFCCRRKHIRSDVAIFLMGDQGQTLFMMISGTVRIERTTVSGKTIHLAQRGAGDHFGEMALLDGKPRMADAYTLTPCDFLVLERDDFLSCLKKSPQIALSMMASLAERLREAADHQENYQGHDVLSRLAAVLVAELAPAQSNSHGPGSAAAKLTQPCSISYHRQKIADQIGSTPESVSRAITSLCAARTLKKQGRNTLQIINLAHLQKLASRDS